jgi:hypothetical protein
MPRWKLQHGRKARAEDEHTWSLSSLLDSAAFSYFHSISSPKFFGQPSKEGIKNNSQM